MCFGADLIPGRCHQVLDLGQICGSLPFLYPVTLSSWGTEKANEKSMEGERQRGLTKEIRRRIPCHGSPDAHGWKCVIRKKLCIDPRFFRIAPAPGVTGGGYWCVAPEFSSIFDHGEFKRRKIMVKPTKNRQSQVSNAPVPAPGSNNGTTVCENLLTGNPCYQPPPGYLQPEQDFTYRY
ncbi:hypothetical protein FKM82_022184 [Ascaphus truei]